MEILLKRGELQKDIAVVLKVDPSTISGEKNKRKKLSFNKLYQIIRTEGINQIVTATKYS